jgi:enoyl-[acyl-carrier protein] reductase I
MAGPAAQAEIPAGTLMQGKRGLIMGVANNRSIAWGIAKAVAAQGAALAFTYQGEALKKRVEPLAAEAGSEIVLPCDVADSGSMEAVFAELGRRWGELDFPCTPSPFPTRPNSMAATSTPAPRTSAKPC